MTYPTPTTPEPDFEELEQSLDEAGQCEATDGCMTDADGFCEHGYPSWLLYLGMI